MIKLIRIIILRIIVKLVKICQKSKLMVLIIRKQFESEKSEILSLSSKKTNFLIKYENSKSIFNNNKITKFHQIMYWSGSFKKKKKKIIEEDNSSKIQKLPCVNFR